VIAEVEDPDPDALDALGGRATRRPADGFYAEIAA
jgi:hypothetical protein